ncbi:hypothetical protein H0H81_011798 [Sphagnurus paluster]|uniref:Beta-glucuronidase C-terminal domain-containing protein n=1 Tax=Sphagnurus paluster TaxID=117069 RepID=A0A9P7K691_9AGAR|nr:hypothetical protein H0H81_011798 [Sphagnurus paluster]
MARTALQKLSALVLLASFTAAVDVAIPLNPARDAPVISPSHISLSIEADRWTSWSGTTSRNEFFYNTLDNLKQITGAPPNIRIGADSEDHTFFRSDVDFQEAVFPDPTANTPYPEAASLVVGDSYYATTRFLPPGTHVTWGVNFGAQNLTSAYLSTRSIVKTFNSAEVKKAGIVLDYLEIGNEPDHLVKDGLRPPTYSSADWVQEWTSFANNISLAAGITEKSYTKFITSSLAGLKWGMSPSKAFDAGLTNSKVGKLISTISQHQYSGNFCSGGDFLLQALMDKYTIRSNLTILVPEIRKTQAHGLKFILGETNSYACHGAPGVSNTAGAALWQIDYSLYASQLGIENLFFHNGVGYKYNMIQPVALDRSSLTGESLATPEPAHVQPTYYAAVVVAEAIDKSTNTRVAEINVDHPWISGYAFYQGSQLQRAVFVNLKGHFASTTTERESVHIDLGFAGNARGGRGPSEMTVKRLAIKTANDVAGLTWGGVSYDTKDGRPTGRVTVEKGKVSEGVDIHATEAILVQFL